MFVSTTVSTAGAVVVGVVAVPAAAVVEFFLHLSFLFEIRNTTWWRSLLLLLPLLLLLLLTLLL